MKRPSTPQHLSLLLTALAFMALPAGEVHAQTSVMFSSASSSVGEPGGSTNLTLDILNPSAVNPTSVDVVLTSGDAARIGNYTTQTVSWPAGDGSPKTLSLSITDNAACDGDANLVLDLQNVSGGNSATAGSPSSHALTVADDESAMGVPVTLAATGVAEDEFTANWNAVPGAAGYFLDVSTSPTFGTPAARVVGWNFNDHNKIADSGVPANATRTITTTASGWEGYSAGVTGYALRKKGWQNGVLSKAWHIEFSTMGLATLTVSSAQRSWNDGPRDFKLQYRIGNSGAWTDVAGANITVADNFTTGVLNNVALPTICDKQPLVQLRWVMRTNINVNGSGPVANGGSSVIDDIVVDAAETPDYLPGYQSLDVGNVTSYNITGLDAETTYYYRVRAYNACDTSVNSNTTSVTTLPFTTYYSRGSGTTLDPIWSMTRTGTATIAAFSSAFHVVVQTGDTVSNTSSIQVNKLTVEAGAALSLAASSSLTVNGDEAIFDGSLTAADNSTLALAGTDATILESTGGPLNLWNLTVNTPQGTLTDATIAIRGTLQLDGGEFDASTGNVTLTSNATGTGRLGAVAGGASYSGNITVQRHIPAGATNWRMLGSPVAGQTVNNWKDDFFTAGFPGSHYPNFYNPVGSGIFWPSIRWYDETVASANADEGVVGVSSNTQALATGQGFLAWSGDNFTSTTAFTVDVTGAPTIAQSPITLPMSFTSSGDVNADGWNLVSNPLPSPIDFTQISRGTDVQNAYWIFNPVSGNTQAWISGFGQGGLNGKIQSSQGFWMKANGTDLATTVSESAKVDQHTGGTFGGSQSPLLPVLNLDLAGSANSYSDMATIVFADGSPAYTASDALKMTFKTEGAPQVGVLSSDGQLLAIDFFGTYTEAIQIPLMVDVDVSGTYTFNVSLTGVNTLSCLSLTDLQTGTVTPLTDGSSYSFSMNADDPAQGRFVINGTAPLGLYVDHALCHGQNGAGSVVVNDVEGPVTTQWTDAFGNILLTMTGNDSSVYEFDAPAGNYTVHVSPVGACGEVSADFTITAPPAIETTVTATATSCPNSDDGNTEVAATGGTAPFSFLWNNGATTPGISGPAGAYSVTVTDANGCTQAANTTIAAGEGTIAGFQANAAALVDEPLAFTNTSVLADSYLWDFGDGSTSTEAAPTHAWALPGTYAVTLTATGGNCTDTFTMEVTVEMSTGISASGAAAALAVWATPDHLVITHTFGSQAVDVDVFDATGRVIMGREGIVMPGRITLDDRKLNTGVWFVRVKSGDTVRTFRVPLVR